MFFNSNDVFKLITCQVCQSTFDDPRLLPCSHTFCARCIKTSLFIKEDSAIECRSCGKKHAEVDVSSFLVNDLALELIRLRPREVSQSDRIKELKQKRAILAEKVGQFKHSLHNGIDEVKNYCAKLKLEVDLQTESLIEEIREYNAGMKKEIDDYEKECTEKFDGEEGKSENEKLLADYEQLNNQTDAYLERFELTDHETKELISQYALMHDELETRESQLRSNKFNSKIVKFERMDGPFDWDDLGEINTDNTDRLYLNGNLKTLTTLADVCDKSTTHLIRSNFSPKGLLALYVDSSYRLILTRLNSKGEIIYKKTLTCLHSFLEPDSLVESDDGVIVSINIRSQAEQKVVILNQEICLNSESKHLLVKLNHSFSYVKHITLKRRCVLIGASSYIYSLVDNEIVSYSSNLSNLELTYEYSVKELNPSSLTHLQWHGCKLFILYQNDELMQHLRVVHLSNNKAVQEIDLYGNDFKQIKLIGFDYLALYNKATTTVNIYCQKNLLLINKIKLDLTDGDWSFSYDSSDTFISLVDRNGKILTGELRVEPDPDADSAQNTED